MQPTRIIGVAVAVGALCATTSAHADPVSDFTFGTTVYLRSATIELAGNKTATGGIALTKPANTLTFDVPASAIGSPLPITLHMVGVALGGNLLHYSFSWSGNVDVDGNGHMLTSASGSFFLKAYHAPGEINAIGNVSLVVMPTVSNIIATGDWGTQTLTIDDGRFYGGYLSASLATYGLSDSAEICSDTTKKTTVGMYVTLNNPAPPTGETVFLTTGYHQGVALPPTVVVPPGKKTGLFNATIAPGFTGIVHTTAAAGGGVGSVDIRVDKTADCQSGTGSNPPLAYNPDPECIQCTVFHGVNDWGERLGLVGRSYVFIDGTTTTTLASMFAAYSPTAISGLAISNSGFLAGITTINGATFAYRSNVHFSPGTLQGMGAITPVAIGTTGTIVGTHPVSSTQGHAAVSYGAGVMELPLPSSFDVYSSTAVSINNVGDVAGAYVMSQGGPLHGFRWSNGVATALPAIAAVPVSINNAGQIAANGVNTAGVKTAGIVAANGAVTLLGNPSGYSGFQIQSMNNSGVVAGVATLVGATSSVQRAFVWSPTIGFRALSGYRPELSVVDVVFQITDDNTVVVHGITPKGVANLYLLPL